MKKSESKYSHTARSMDDALIALLGKKDFELITIKEICQKAGVNRSTFYLHYENTYDLLRECVEQLGREFAKKFEGITIDVEAQDLSKLLLIDEDHLIPYLEFVRENRTLFKAVHDHAELFGTDRAYRAMYERVFDPILRRFGSPQEDNAYIMEYFSHGLSALVLKWVAEGCVREISEMVGLIKLCVGFQRV